VAISASVDATGGGSHNRGMAGPGMDRRAWLRFGAALAVVGPAVRTAAQQPATVPPSRLRPIPASGERVPAVGLGSWITFNVGRDGAARAQCADVMRAFFAAGGRLIDSSPMYGSSQEVIGEGLRRLGATARVFAADKVWVTPGSRGPAQIDASRELWGVPRFDLLQVHNLLAWQEHLPLLLDMKASGRVRYVGITTSEGRRLREIEQIMRSHPIDVVQVTYSLADRRVEERILPLAQERGIAVIANRPFEQGDLLRALERHPLPPLAAELQCASWAQFTLKFVVSHPAVTCAIAATTRVDHVRENMAAGLGAWPDEAQRRLMRAHTEKML
jgi:diketogulonate reductase-like aldo/keto reductase